MDIFKIENQAAEHGWKDKEIDWPAECAAENIDLKIILPLVYWCGEDKGSGVGSIVYQWENYWYFEEINYSKGQNPLYQLGYALAEYGYDTLDELYNDSCKVLRPEIGEMVAELKRNGFN